MSRRAANFVQADLSRALRAARAAGDGWRVDVLPGGVISIVPVRITPTEHLPPLDTADDDGSTIVL